MPFLSRCQIHISLFSTFWCQVCNEAQTELDANIASIVVNNAVKKVGQGICNGLPTNCQLARDCTRLEDFLSKDFVKLAFVQRVLEISKAIYSFPRIDSIDSMRREVINDSTLQDSNAVVTYTETRMNNVHKTVKSTVYSTISCSLSV